MLKSVFSEFQKFKYSFRFRSNFLRKVQKSENLKIENVIPHSKFEKNGLNFKNFESYEILNTLVVIGRKEEIDQEERTLLFSCLILSLINLLLRSSAFPKQLKYCVFT